MMAVAVDTLNSVLDSTWQTISEAYDVISAKPDLLSLFMNCDLTDIIDTAESVVLNMLIEIMERVDRFSPWYTLPARAFGIMRLYEGGRIRWILAQDAVQRWQPQLQSLSDAIEDNMALLEAELLVGCLLEKSKPEDMCVLACCQCVPRRSILINQAALNSTEIVCGECHEVFRQVV